MVREIRFLASRTLHFDRGENTGKYSEKNLEKICRTYRRNYKNTDPFEVVMAPQAKFFDILSRVSRFPFVFFLLF